MSGVPLECREMEEAMEGAARRSETLEEARRDPKP